MFDLNDPRWKTLYGGYRVPYDPTQVLRCLATRWQDDDAWKELWDELHHQGDLGDASYAAVPFLVKLARDVRERGWNVYALVATIEIERHRRSNPLVPSWLVPAYGQAWADLFSLALEDLRTTTDPLVVQSALGVVALAKGETRLGALISNLDASERDEALDEQFGWSELYRDDLEPPLLRGNASSRPSP